MTEAYKTVVTYEFEVLGESIAIVEVGDDFVVVEEVAKNGQEDTHMAGVLKSDPDGQFSWDEGERMFIDYHSQEMADGIREYVSRHGLPGRSSNGMPITGSSTQRCPHDVFEDMDSRLTKDEHRSPRVVIVSECHDGQYSWAELSNDGTTGDTTLTGVVLKPIERAIRGGQIAGTVTIDGIVYVFVFGQYRG